MPIDPTDDGVCDEFVKVTVVDVVAVDDDDDDEAEVDVLFDLTIHI